MTAKNTMKAFRKIDRSTYPELAGYSDREVYDYFVGCGGLYLATNMVRQMKLKKGDIVLDLGCGFGSSSIFLAKTFGVTVIAADLWFSPEILLGRIAEAGLSSNIIPLNIDITKTIPFADKYFDAIFCMNSLFLYGDNLNFLRRLLGTLKQGGVFCVGSECFNREAGYMGDSDIPREFNFNWKWNVWESCYSRYHSPEWWEQLVSETKLIDMTYCKELADGPVLFEDLALNYHNYINDEILSLGAVIPQERIAAQIVYGKKNEIYPTMFVLSGIRSD